MGSIGLIFGEDIYRKNAELAYWVAADFQGKGIASKAIKQLTEKVFSTTSVTTIYAKPFGSNIASQKLLEKCGFTLEARLKNFIYKNNGYQDELVFILRKP